MGFLKLRRRQFWLFLLLTITIFQWSQIAQSKSQESEEQDILLEQFHSSELVKVPKTVVRLTPNQLSVMGIEFASYQSLQHYELELVSLSCIQELLELSDSQADKIKQLDQLVDDLDDPDSVKKLDSVKSPAPTQLDGEALKKELDHILTASQSKRLSQVRFRCIARSIGYHRAIQIAMEGEQIELSTKERNEMRRCAKELANEARKLSKNLIANSLSNIFEVLSPEQRNSLQQEIGTAESFQFPEIFAFQLRGKSEWKDSGLYEDLGISVSWSYLGDDITFTETPLGVSYGVGIVVFQMLNGQMEPDVELLPNQIDSLTELRKDLLEAFTVPTTENLRTDEVRRREIVERVKNRLEDILIPAQMEYWEKKRSRFLFLRNGVRDICKNRLRPRLTATQESQLDKVSKSQEKSILKQSLDFEDLVLKRLTECLENDRHDKVIELFGDSTGFKSGAIGSLLTTLN